MDPLQGVPKYKVFSINVFKRPENCQRWTSCPSNLLRIRYGFKNKFAISRLKFEMNSNLHNIVIFSLKFEQRQSDFANLIRFVWNWLKFYAVASFAKEKSCYYNCTENLFWYTPHSTRICPIPSDYQKLKLGSWVCKVKTLILSGQELSVAQEIAKKVSILWQRSVLISH